MKLINKITVPVACILMIAAKVMGQGSDAGIPKLIEKDGHHALLVDGRPFFILGGQAHNSSGWPGMLPQLWEAVSKMNANTLEVPIYWEQVEAQPGKFDFSVIDTLLMQARAHKVRLVLLWFATWKNGSNHYMPEWMKRDATKYPNISGKNGQPVDSPTPHSKAALEADIKAFTAVMGYLKKADALHTVIMVQVENEPGAWGSVRDYGAAAQKSFEAAVPPELLKPELLKAVHHAVVAKGSWQEVFGSDADEYFHAWSVAHYIQQVAAAGKAVYALPLYVNAALRDPLTNPPANNYESGGPTDNVIPIWKAAAPAIDLVAPDIYLSGSERILKVIDLYNRPDNTLFVPEASLSADKVKYLYEVIARGGIGFSPFGIDETSSGVTMAEQTERLAPFAQEYAMMVPMMRQLTKWAFEGKIKAVVEREDHAMQTVDLGEWQALLSFGGPGRGSQAPQNAQPTGKLLIVQLEENKFVVMGTLSHISFRPVGKNAGRTWQYMRVEEGTYEKEAFVPLRILNGDETDWGGPRFGAAPTILQVTVGVR